MPKDEKTKIISLLPDARDISARGESLRQKNKNKYK